MYASFIKISKNRSTSAGLIFALLAVFLLMLQYNNFSSSWRLDDGPHLNFIAEYSPWQYFFIPEVIHFQSWVHYTPWNALFYEIGAHFWGLNVSLHYFHLAFVIWLSAIATYFLLRIWMNIFSSLLGALLFLSMPTTGGVGQMLMTGHYAYGLLFSVLSFYSFVKGVNENRHLWSALSSVLFLLACVCKELYPPILAIFLLIPSGRFATRLQHFPWLAVAGFAYACFRLYLFPLTTSYIHPVVGSTPTFQGLADGMITTLFGLGWPGNIYFYLSLLYIFYLIFTSRHLINFGLIICSLIVCALPISATLGSAYADPAASRFLYFASWCLAVGLATTLQRHESSSATPWTRYIALLVFIGLGTISQNNALGKFGVSTLEAQYKFLATHSGDTYLLPYQFKNISYLNSLRSAVQLIENRAAPHIIRSEDELRAIGIESRFNIFFWDTACQCVMPLGNRYIEYLYQHDRALAAGQNSVLGFRVEVEDRGLEKILKWSIKTNINAHYYLHFIEYGKLSVPPMGELAFGLDATGPKEKVMHFRLYASTDDGALSRSPIFVINPRSNNFVEWQGLSSAL